jgi:hypothetical protein
MASLGYQTPSDMASEDAADEFATFESPFPFSTINWDDLVADEIAFSKLKPLPFSTIDTDDFTLGFTRCDVVRPAFCCESEYFDYTVFVVKRCPFKREPDGQHGIEGGAE